MRQDNKASDRVSKSASKSAREIDRRRLLTGAGLAIGAAGATAVSTVTPAAASEPAKPEHDGYRETEHVKTYYRLASF